MDSDVKPPGISRRMLFRSAAGVAAGAFIDRFSQRAEAHDLVPTEPGFRFAQYEAIVNRNVQIKQVYEWPTLTNPIIFANIRNGMNGAQFSYGVPADQIQVVVQCYASANAATYDDAIWEKYRLGELFSVRDPRTGQPATRNIWYKSQLPASAASSPPLARNHPYYADTSMEGLQRRGVLFLI